MAINSNDNIILFHVCLAVRQMLNMFKSNSQNTAKEKLKELDEIVQIKANYNIPDLLTTSFKLGVQVLVSFNSPTLLWNIINMLTLLLELLQYKGDDTIASTMANMDIMKIISKPSELIEDAMIDMERALINTFSSSACIIGLSFQLLNYRMHKYGQYLGVSHSARSTKSNEYNVATLNYWLFCIRTIQPVTSMIILKESMVLL